MIIVGKHYRLKLPRFRNYAPLPTYDVPYRVIGVAVVTDSNAYDRITLENTETGEVSHTYSLDVDFEPMEDCNE